MPNSTINTYQNNISTILIIPYYASAYTFHKIFLYNIFELIIKCFSNISILLLHFQLY